MNKRPSKSTKKTKTANKVAANLLKGTVPDFDDPAKYYITFFATVAFWMFVAWKVSTISLAVPAIFNLLDFIRSIRSP